MIKQLITEKGHNKRFDNLTPNQQEQYNNIICDIEAEKDEYIVGVDLADRKFSDHSVVCKAKIINGKFHIIGFKYIEQRGVLCENQNRKMDY